MAEIVTAGLDRLQVVVLLGWYDGPTEGIARRRGGKACWYFKLCAQQLDTGTVDDRFFALWAIPPPDGSVLSDEYGDRGGVHWPDTGELGSGRARSIVEELSTARPGPPSLLVRTNFDDVFGVWSWVLDHTI